VRLHSPRFEKALCREVKKAVRASPDLKRDCRGGRQSPKHYNSSSIIRGGMSFLLAAVVWPQAANHGLLAGLAVLTLWTFVLTCIHAQSLVAALHSSRDLPAFSILPIPAREVFRWQWHKFLWRSRFSAIDLLAGFSVLALVMHLSGVKWLALFPILLVAWFLPLCLATFLVARFPSFPVRPITVLLVGAFMLLPMGDLIGGAAGRFFENYALLLTLLVPTGWPMWLFHSLVPGANLWDLSILIPILAFIGTFRSSVNCLRLGYAFHEIILPKASDILPAREKQPNGSTETPPAPGMPDPVPAAPVHVGVTAIEEFIFSRRFLSAPEWAHRGRFENLLWKWLNEREKVLSDFAFPDGISIAAPWKKVARHFLVTMAIAASFGFLIPSLNIGVLSLSLFISIGFLLARFLDFGLCFRPLLVGGISIPIYAGYGLGYRELGRFLFKCSVVQLPHVLLYGTTCGVAVTLLTGYPVGIGLMFGFKSALLIFIGRVIVVTFAFSAGTNDSNSSRWKVFLLLPLITFFCITFLGFGIASLLVFDQRLSCLLLGLAALDAYTFFRLYGWLYNAGWFDLMKITAGKS
jgi:hypothetical protein